MNNITFEASSFSEQLGIYDFFNVLISGAIFVFGLSIVNEKIGNYLLGDITVAEGLGLVLLIYIIGLILQEIASFLDREHYKIYTGMNRRILMGNVDVKCIRCKRCEKFNEDSIIKNPVLLRQYRKHADMILGDLVSDTTDKRYDDEFVNGFVFSICQYYVAINGKDKKVEKMRALFSMAKTLMVCFALLAAYTLLALVFNVEISIEIWNTLGLPSHGCAHCLDKIILFIVFAGMARMFLWRAKKVMHRFLLILLGTYDAIIRSEKVNDKEKEVNGHTPN